MTELNLAWSLMPQKFIEYDLQREVDKYIDHATEQTLSVCVEHRL